MIDLATWQKIITREFGAPFLPHGLVQAELCGPELHLRIGPREVIVHEESGAVLTADIHREDYEGLWSGDILNVSGNLVGWGQHAREEDDDK